jgi:hypothetical protein
MTLPAIFAILVGVGMVAQWATSFATRQIPELQTEPFRIWFHIAGEMVTAVSLITAGVGLLISQPWGPALYLVATGMLIYTRDRQPGLLRTERPMDLGADLRRPARPGHCQRPGRGQDWDLEKLTAQARR